METKRKTSPAVAPVATATQNGPLRVFLIDDVSASVFSREHQVRGEPQTFYSVSFSRSYKDVQGARKYVKTFNPEDLGKITALAQQASEYIHGLTEPKAE